MLANYLTLTEFELQVVLDWQQDQQSLLEIPRWRLPVRQQYFIQRAEATSTVSEL